jgi:hypothetical protein
MKKSQKKTKNAWFRYRRRSYLPASWQGLAIYSLYVGYSIVVPVVWYNDGHNLWKLLTTVIPLLILAALVTQFIASKNTK